ncbi:unnamed protein product [Auanema sp. JU1783]|nr:unnamed protein product [Auanema sp. JU1783]
MVNGSETLGDLLKQGGIIGEGSNLALLSDKIKRRICALKGNQLKSIEIESKFYEKVHNLEKEFEADFAKIYKERRDIVTGEHEPTEEEANFPLLHGMDEEDKAELYSRSSPDDGTKGIPAFWLQVLRSTDGIGEVIRECDEPILEHLIDINTEVSVSPPGFTIFFHFSPNPFFKNTILKKKYELQISPDHEAPFDFDGPIVSGSTGDVIEWEEGKNVTKKVVKKKAKKGANAGRFLTKTVQNESFFNFFTPIDPAEVNQEAADHNKLELTRVDYELGQLLRDHVIPRAVLFYTGENDLSDDFDLSGEDFEDDDSEEDDGDE